MINKLNRFAVISGGGIVIMMVLGMAVFSLNGTTVEQVNSFDAVTDWAHYRIAFYLTVVSLWVPICKWITLPNNHKNRTLSKTKCLERDKKRKEDFIYLRTLWWKVLLAFVVVEVAFIQRFWA